METPCFTTNALFLDNESPCFQKFFQERDSTETLTDEANEFLCTIVHASLEAIIKGSCKLAVHRNSDNLGLHDVVLFLKTQFNLDPMRVAAGYYYVTETDSEDEIPPRRKQRTKSSEKCLKTSKSLDLK